MERSARGSLSGDVAGGFAATLIAIPQAMSLGILAFAALGPGYASIGIAAALLASIIGNLVAATSGAMTSHIVGARASVTALVATMVAMLAAHPSFQAASGPDAGRILALVSVTVLLSGAFQIAFGLAGIGRVIKFVPYPVIAGIMTGIALIILVSQLRPALGLAGYQPLLETLGELGAAKPASALVAATAVVAIWLAPRVTRKVPALLCGLLAGIIVHYVAAWIFPGSTGPLVGALPGKALWPDELAPMLEFIRVESAYSWLSLALPTAILLAAVGALDGLLAAMAVDAVTRGRHSSDRVLLGQGVSSVILAGFGAIPAVGNTHAPLASFLAGGRTPRATLFHAGFMLAAMFVLGPLFAQVPIAALAGLMIYIAFTLVDRWTRDLLRRLETDDEHRNEILVNVCIVGAVALAQLLLNTMVAFAIGVGAAVVLLVVKLSGSPVRRSFDGTVRTSLKLRGHAAREALETAARDIRILELQGELFFGTADRLQLEVEGLPDGTQYVILDFRRVNQIDASGARMLEVIGHRAARRNTRLLISHLREDEPRGKYLRTLGLHAVVGPGHWFTDLDRALEWAEDRLLEKLQLSEEGAELPPARMALFEGLDDGEVVKLAQHLQRREFKHGDVVFREGEAGDCLYLIAQGAVSIKVQLDDSIRARRLATFASGVMFGEMALLEGHRRSADAFAKGERVVLYSLEAGAFRDLLQSDPGLGLKVYRNLSRDLAARLRVTTGALRAIE